MLFSTVTLAQRNQKNKIKYLQKCLNFHTSEFSLQVLAIRGKMEGPAGRGCKRNISSAKLSLASLPYNLWPFSASTALPCQMVLLTKASCKFQKEKNKKAMSGSPHCKNMWRKQQGKSLLLQLGEQRDNIVMKHLSFHCVSAYFMGQHLFCY